MCALEGGPETNVDPQEIEPKIAGKVAQKDLKTPKMNKVSSTVEVNTFVTYFGDGNSDKRRLDTRRIRLSDLHACLTSAPMGQFRLN